MDFDEEGYIREIGRIIRIVDADYVNGALFKCRFEMNVFDIRDARWSKGHKWFDFYGTIPREYIGQEAKYFASKRETERISSINADLRVGKIKERNTGTYDIVVPENFKYKLKLTHINYGTHI